MWDQWTRRCLCSAALGAMVFFGANEAWGLPIRAQMGWCEIFPDGTGSDHRGEPFGSTAATRKMWLHFSYSADPGIDGILTGSEIAAALAETASVEVCSIQADLLGTSLPVIHCPWSEGLQGGEDWLLYDSAAPPPQNDVFDSRVQPLADRIETRGATTALEWSRVPADFWSLQNHGLILFFRTRTADDPYVVPPYWGPYGVQAIVGDGVNVLGDGFCAVPTPLPWSASWVDPGTSQLQFYALGIPLERFDGPYAGPYSNPFFAFNLDPCTQGSVAPGVVIPGVSACVDPLLAQWTTARLHNVHEWQWRHLQGEHEYAQPTWQWGTGGDCAGDCPTNVVFQQHNALQGGFSDNARVSFPPVNEWSQPWAGADAREGRFAIPLSILAHEWHHQFASNGWRRNNGLVWQGSYPSVPPLFHVDTNVFAKMFCEDDYPGLTGADDPCVSATRLARLPAREANAYLANPAQQHLHVVERGWLFLKYAMEQFAAPKDPANPAHPDGADSALRWVEPQLPLGHYRRRPDEGADLLRHIFDGYLHPDNQLKPAAKATGFGIEQALHRNLDSLMLDYHTAIALKDYSDRPNYKDDPRWRLEWVGSYTVGGADEFPDNAQPPFLGGLPATIARTKDWWGGRLPHVTGPANTSPHDDLLQARRIGDDWDYVNQDPIFLNQGDAPIGTSVPVTLAPYGAAILSRYVDRSDPINWPLRVRIEAKGDDLEAARVRIFTIDGNHVPHLRTSCQWTRPGCTETSCTEMCPFEMFVDGQGDLTVAVEETILILRDSSVDTDIDEVIVVVSAGHKPASFTWIMGDSHPYLEIIEPTAALPVPIGHAKLPIGIPAGSRPFLLKFRIANGDNEPLVIPLNDIQIEIPDCDMYPPYVLQPWNFTLHRFDPAEYWAVVTVPDDCYPDASSTQHDLDVRVSALGGTISASEQDALRVSPQWPRVGMQLVLDRSDSMTEDKLEAAKIAGQLLIEGLADDDAVGVVSFEEDATIDVGLQSLCSIDRSLVIAGLWGVETVTCGRTSLGDGLFEAQAVFAGNFDQFSPLWDGTLVDCKPDTHAMVVLSDGMNNEPWEPHHYYDYGPPTADFGDAFMQPYDGPRLYAACNVHTFDDQFFQGGWLRYSDRVERHLQVPIISAIAFGEDADKEELQKLLGHTSLGSIGYIEGPADDSFETRMRMTVEMSDRFRQSANATSGHERVGAWAPPSIHPEDMPLLEVEPLTRELLVSVSSARDDTSVLELVTPSGQIVQPVVQHPVATVFRVADPEPGPWRWKATGPVKGPPWPGGPPAVFVELAVRGPLRLHAEADVTLPWPVPPGGGPYEDGRFAGSEVTIRALPTTGSPILDAAVVAEVKTPDGMEAVVKLFDDGQHGDAQAGDGIYGARFSDTLAAGVYSMRVVATGISPLSKAPFVREKTVALHLHDGDDKDRDRLPDWWEQKHTGGLTALTTTGDADHDGLVDLREYELDLSPLRADTDGGGEADASELARGRDPLDPADDQAEVFEPSVAPGNGKALVDLRIPFLLEASAELERASSPEGPWTPAFFGVPPADGVVAVEAGNDVEACLRMRTLTARATSDWSAPFCVLPRLDPLPPRLSVRLDSARLGGTFVTRRDSDITLRLDASDAPPQIFGTEVRGAYFLGEGAGYELFDPLVVESGVSDMMVSLEGTFEGASWQPFEPAVVVGVPGGDYFVVHVKVRDGAGNESEPVAVPVRIEDDWPAGYALVGLRSLLLEHGSSVAGRVAVLEASAEEDAWELVLAPGARVNGSARADSVLLLPGAEVTGSVYANALGSSGLVGGEHVSPIGVPVYLRLPRMPEVEPGDTDVAVGKGNEQYLEPGSYGALVLAAGDPAEPTVLVLSGGTYHLERLAAGKHARVECAAPCEIRVGAALTFDKESYLGPRWGDQPARDVGVYVSADAGGDEDAVRIGKDGIVRARISALAGKLRFGQGVLATGAFVARDVRVGHGATVTGSGP